VHALAGQCIQVRRQGRNQRLALSGAHLRNLALVQRDAAHELHVEVAHLQGALRGLAHDRKGFGQKIIEALALLQALAELCGLGGELAIAQRLGFGLEGSRLANRTVIGAQQSLVAATKEARQKLRHVDKFPERRKSEPRQMLT
jgi:hypothetical protein